MRQAVIVDALRTPMGQAKSDTGMFRDERADDLSAHVIRALVDRTGIEPATLGDIRWGCVQQQGEQGFNVARMAGLIAGIPIEVPAVTINRLCASAMEAVADSAMSVMIGYSDAEVAGGVEHMSHLPMDKDYDASPRLHRKWSPAVMLMGMTAEYLAIKYKIPRAAQDEMAYRSHHLAAEATEKGEFADEIVPTWARTAEGHRDLCTRDQGIREDTTLEVLSSLPPVFAPGVGTVTAGNSSQLTVGACAVLVTSEQKARELGMKPMARIVSFAAAAVDPGEMGVGPVPATMKALNRAGLKLKDMDIIELNEAFASQGLTVLKLLNTDMERVNLHGGAIALGHPLGCSGARIVTTLVHLMRQRDARYGLATLCVGGGQGMAMVLESCR